MTEDLKVYGVFGAGGFGREVIPLVRHALEKDQQTKGSYEIVFVVEGIKEPSVSNGYRVISDTDFLAISAKKYFNIAIASYKVRERIAESMISQGVEPFSIIAQNTVMLDENQIGEGAIFCPFTTVTSNAKIGKFFHANIYSYVAHDCVVGDYVTFAPNVHCNGTVTIEDYVYVGTGAIIKQGMPDKPIVIGKGAVIGMGAVVTKSVAPFTTVIGNPAAPMVKK